MLFLTLLSYRMSVKMSIGLTPFPLLHGTEFMIPIKWKILTLQIGIELLQNIAQLEAISNMLNKWILLSRIEK